MKAVRIIALLLVLCMCSTLLLACAQKNGNTNTEANGNDGNDMMAGATDSGKNYLEANNMVIGSTSIADYNIVYPKDAFNSERAFAEDLAAWIKETIGVEVKVITDSSSATAHEILIGKTNRSESNTSALFTSDYDFNVSIKNSKLIVEANGKSGYDIAFNALTKSIVKNKGAINANISNDKLSYGEIQAISVGAVRYTTSDMGLHFWKSTQLQIDNWTANTKGWENNTTCTQHSTGVRLDFDTDSSYFYFKVTDGKDCVVLINGEQILQNVSSHLQLLDTSKGTNRVTILLPSGTSSSWALEAFEVESGSNTTLHDFDFKILFLGDSITEGYNNYNNVSKTYTFQLAEKFNASAVVQGNSGSQFWSNLLDPEFATLYQPDIIYVAMGTNDWDSYETGWSFEQYKARCREYLTQLRVLYPETPIIGVVPIDRRDLTTDEKKASFAEACDAEACDAYAEVYEEFGAFVVRGVDVIPNESKYYADNVHPNDIGFIVYGENLYEATKDYVASVLAD